MKIEDKFAAASVTDAFAELSVNEKADADFKAQIAMAIHSKRMEMKMTQKEFAEFAGVSQAMVSKWESGEYNFSIDSLSGVMNLLGLKIEITAA